MRSQERAKQGLVCMGCYPHCHSNMACAVTAYFNLSSYLYLSRLIHDMSLIIYELSVPPACLHHMYIHTHARVNTYWTYPLSVMVDESVREIERSEDEDESKKVKDDICQLLNQRTASQH